MDRRRRQLELPFPTLLMAVELEDLLRLSQTQLFRVPQAKKRLPPLLPPRLRLTRDLPRLLLLHLMFHHGKWPLTQDLPGGLTVMGCLLHIPLHLQDIQPLLVTLLSSGAHALPFQFHLTHERRQELLE